MTRHREYKREGAANDSDQLSYQTSQTGKYVSPNSATPKPHDSAGISFITGYELV